MLIGAINKKPQRLEWMYKGAIGVTSESEKEGYLLGKPIDRQVDALIQEREKEEEAMKTKEGALFMRKGKTSFAKDLAVKIREDPLLAIKQKEEERKQLILNNPLKLKKLRNYLERKEGKKNKLNKPKTVKDRSSNKNENFKDNAQQNSYPLKRKHEDQMMTSPYKKPKREYKRDVSYFNERKKVENGKNEEELEKLRIEMMHSAEERESEISKRVQKMREKLKREEEFEKNRPRRNFTQDLRRNTHKVYDNLDLESSIRRSKYKVQRNATELEDGFTRK